LLSIIFKSAPPEAGLGSKLVAACRIGAVCELCSLEDKSDRISCFEVEEKRTLRGVACKIVAFVRRG